MTAGPNCFNVASSPIAGLQSAESKCRAASSHRRIWTALLLATLFCSIAGAIAAPSPASSSYLRIAGQLVETTHGLNYTLSLPSRFRLAQPENRTDAFNGHPFRISLTAFVSADAAVMVQAETVLDRSGASTYENLPSQSLHGLTFHVRPDQCVDLKRDELTGEHDLEWLDAHGFPPIGPLVLRQFLANSADHNSEVVISFLQRVSDCNDKSANAAALHNLQDQLRISSKPMRSAESKSARP
jgi:hypothetical protein